ncbi:hypothetical protein [Streptomyces sp. CC228A]|uniref:hypothetical protein n=1 Tax=Streptomyces sp. CC228A TaxID=2898186 RepID=UPI001F47264F|nr:hypothetical protein [Streptomyces sp. CC228A]
MLVRRLEGLLVLLLGLRVLLRLVGLRVLRVLVELVRLRGLIGRLVLLRLLLRRQRQGLVLLRLVLLRLVRRLVRSRRRSPVRPGMLRGRRPPGLAGGLTPRLALLAMSALRHRDSYV